MSQNIQNPPESRRPIPLFRLSITGLFMGLANLVPGVSGGTMVLALGLYDEFIGAVSDLTRLRFSARPIIVLAMLFGISGATIVLFAAAMQYLMEMFLPGMLALFIGMTLGGAPLLWRQLRPATPASVGFAVLGVAIMALLAFVLRPDQGAAGFGLFFVGGIVGSMAMILPGISGSYLLLVLGLYLPIIGGIGNAVHGLRMGDFDLIAQTFLGVMVPVGLGVLVGIVSLSNLLKYFLTHHERPTVGFLLGLLLGSVLGLYPFQSTSFDKLPRHGNVMPDGGVVVEVHGYGWEAEPGDRVFEALRALERNGVSIEIAKATTNLIPSESAIAAARAASAVVIAYDLNVPRSVRRAASEKVGGDDVELLIVPNTEFTPLKGMMVVVLIAAGFVATLLLGRLGGEEGGGNTPSPGLRRTSRGTGNGSASQIALP